MKPSKMRPGQKFIINGSEAVYVRRHPAQSGRPAKNIIRILDCVGLNGPDDDGACVISDYDFARKAHPCQQAA